MCVYVNTLTQKSPNLKNFKAGFYFSEILQKITSALYSVLQHIMITGTF